MSGDTTQDADTFAALSAQIRVDVLRALWEREDHRATFSQLRADVGVDDSGKFNYHLGELREQFVTKTDEGDYRLRTAGIDIVGSLIAGSYDDSGATEPVEFGQACPACGTETTVVYDGEFLQVECDPCETTLVTIDAPSSVFAGVEANAAAIAERAREYLHHSVASFRRQFCSFCESVTHPRVTAEHDPDGRREPEALGVPRLERACTECGETIAMNLAPVVLDHPAVVRFFHDHGVDYREIGVVDVVATTTDRAVVTQTNPVTAEVQFTREGETIRVAVDETGQVTETERSPAGSV